MFNPDRKYYLKISENTGFHKDVIEKVHRLIVILEYINGNAFLRDRLILKGGTALNLTVLIYQGYLLISILIFTPTIAEK